MISFAVIALYSVMYYFGLMKIRTRRWPDAIFWMAAAAIARTALSTASQHDWATLSLWAYRGGVIGITITLWQLLSQYLVPGLRVVYQVLLLSCAGILFALPADIPESPNPIRACRLHFKQLGLAFHLYHEIHDQFPPRQQLGL
ncbi:hypothetical protein [Planctomicrobium sp. SH664]|uniref:hypothetical protein n=1 Tax=Planctomicrobium sp. SH664 TaxID=3448125 RepID=UPI003F5C496D